MSLQDVVLTVMVAVEFPTSRGQPLAGHQTGDKHFPVHIDGYIQLPYHSRTSPGWSASPHAHEFIYSGERDPFALRS